MFEFVYNGPMEELSQIYVDIHEHLLSSNLIFLWLLLQVLAEQGQGRLRDQVDVFVDTICFMMHFIVCPRLSML